MPIPPSVYRTWIERFDTLSGEDIEAAREFARTLKTQPRVDVVVPIYDPPEAFLEEAIASVRRQVYENWRLYLYDDCSTQPYVRRTLDRVAREDGRIHVAYGSNNGGIAAATNAGLALGSSPFVFFLDHDDVIEPHALLMFAHALDEAPDANLVYSDGDILTAEGQRANPFFKPDYDHQLLLGINMAWGLFRRSLLERLGGMSLDYPGSEDYDLVLRAAEHVPEHTIRHIPHVLGHWRMVSTSFSHTRFATTLDSARKAVQDHCFRLGMSVEVLPTTGARFWNRIRPLPALAPHVTIVLEAATAEAEGELKSRYVEATDYDKVEIMCTPSTDATVGRARNETARHASGELIVFLDVRLTPRNRDWLRDVVGQFVDPRCAAVGARVVRADGRVEQCGVLFGVRERPRAFPIARALHGALQTDSGYYGRAELSSRASAVAGGMVAVRRSTLLELGGFDESMDDTSAIEVDFCLRARAGGWILVTCPHAIFDAAMARPWFEPSRARDVLQERWGRLLEADPHYNPNLTNLGTHFGLAFPPRVRFPWRRA